MALQHEDIPWIKGTPLGISLRSIEYCPPHYHENILEFIMSGGFNTPHLDA